MSRRVVLTGLGGITPLSPSLPLSFARLFEPPTPTTHPFVRLQAALTEEEWKLAESNPCQVVAAVPDEFIDVQVRKHKARFMQFAAHAGAAALANANLTPGSFDPEAVGVAIGSGIGSIATVTAGHDFLGKSLRKLSPHFVPSVLCNSAAAAISISHGLMGPQLCSSTACAAGAHSLAEAYKAVRDGDADVMLAGGAEAAVDPLSLAGFSRMRALSTGFNDNRESSSRPFDKKRDGFVMGEGAAVLVLESLDHALSRGANIIAEMSGYGYAGDAFHAAAPDPEGRGAERAMRAALSRAGIRMGEVGYLNAHATSTPVGDAVEIKAIGRIVEKGESVVVGSTKGATGHLLGAAGAAEAAFAVMALMEERVPGTRNLENLDVGEYDEERIDILMDGEERRGEIVHVMSNSFGFGGTNCSLVFSKYRY